MMRFVGAPSYVRNITLVWGLVLMSLLSACSSSNTPKPDITLTADEVADARDDAAMAELLNLYNPENNAWQKGPTVDAIVNSYERTRNPDYLRLLERSFRSGRGWRSVDANKLFYDDMGWYANAWLRAYDVTGDRHYLTEAQIIFDEMTDAWDDTCGGGLWWNHEREYKNAITNELFLLAAARLARRAPDAATDYEAWANRTWTWFDNSGMINDVGLVNDGLENCVNNGDITWSYNQGVILGALVEMWRISGDRSYLAQAEEIAEATIANLVFPSGVLQDVCDTFEEGCTNDALIFKGMFAQGLARLYNADRNNKPQYLAFLNTNADAIWERSRNENNALGVNWNGPVGAPSVQSHAAGMLLVGGVALLASGGETSTPPTSTTYEAETAILNGLSAEHIFEGHSGGGYVGGWNQDAQWLDFEVNVTQTRSYRVTIRYAAAAGDATRFLYVNGSSRASNLPFPDTGAWDSYTSLSFDLELNAGSNVISFIFSEGLGNKNYLNIDKIDVE